MEDEITQVLALAVAVLSEAVLLTEVESGRERVIFANQAFARLSGYSLAELKESGLRLLQGPETDSFTLQRLLQPSHLGEQEPVDILLYKKEGTPFRDRATIRRVATPNKLFRVQVHTDVSRQKEIENKLVLIQEHEAGSHLIRAIAHDFNNSLTGIQVYSGLLAEKARGDAQLRRYVDQIHAAVERAHQSVAQIQSLAGREPRESDVVDLHEIVQQNSELLRRALGDEIQLKIEAAPELSKVTAHPTRIRHVLLNLVLTAREVMPNGGEVLIRLRNEMFDGLPSAPRNFVLLLVHVAGQAINTESFASVTKRFFAIGSQDSTIDLWLFVVRTIVEQHGGSIQLETETGKWAEFRIVFAAAGAEKPG